MHNEICDIGVIIVASWTGNAGGGPERTAVGIAFVVCSHLPSSGRGRLFTRIQRIPVFS